MSTCFQEQARQRAFAAGRKAGETASRGQLLEAPYPVADVTLWSRFRAGADEALTRRNLRVGVGDVVEADPALPRVARLSYRGGGGGYVTTVGTFGTSPADCYRHGRAVGAAAAVGDDLPHPGNEPHPRAFGDGVADALAERGLEPSMFGRVIVRDGGSQSLVDGWCRALRAGRDADARWFADEAFRWRHVELTGRAPARLYRDTAEVSAA